MCTYIDAFGKLDNFPSFLLNVTEIVYANTHAHKIFKLLHLYLFNYYTYSTNHARDVVVEEKQTSCIDEWAFLNGLVQYSNTKQRNGK